MFYKFLCGECNTCHLKIGRKVLMRWNIIHLKKLSELWLSLESAHLSEVYLIYILFLELPLLPGVKHFLYFLHTTKVKL
jgi:hypothetical protein